MYSFQVINIFDKIQIRGDFGERRDSSFIHHTRLCVCIKGDIQFLRRNGVESDKVVSLWIELQLPVRSVFIGFIIVIRKILLFGGINFVIC